MGKILDDSLLVLNAGKEVIKNVAGIKVNLAKVSTVEKHYITNEEHVRHALKFRYLNGDTEIIHLPNEVVMLRLYKSINSQLDKLNPIIL